MCAIQALDYADQLNHLFEPFNRFGQEAHVTEGTGIGLIVSKKLIELMQGNIGAQSTINEGSVFWIRLISIRPNSTNAIVNKNDVVKKIYKLKESNTNMIDRQLHEKIKANQVDAQIVNKEFINDELVRVKNSRDEPAKTIVFEGSDLQRLLALQSQSMDNAFKKIGLQSSFQADLTTGEHALPADKFSQDLVNTLLAKQSSTPFKKLLYVEDDSANFNLAQEMVALRDDIQLKVATNKAHGMSIAETWLPDVILMDINLSDLSGFELLELLTKNPATHATPVIAISANAMLSKIQKGIEAGFFRNITKPVKLEELTRVLDFAFEYAQMTKLRVSSDI